MPVIRFLFREGSSILFSTFLIGFAFVQDGGWIPHTAGGMFFFSLVCLAYLGLQMSMAAFATVGQDRPLFDLFFSIIPLFALFGIVVLAAVRLVELEAFDIYALILAAIATALDVIFNTQVIFKMNRLATDMVQMR